MKKNVIFVIFLNLYFISNTQNILQTPEEIGIKYSTLNTNTTKANIQINSNPQLQLLLSNYAVANANRTLKVYRVQIFFGSGPESRAKANNIKSNFENKFLGVPTMLVFEEPYFKVKVGSFENKIQAEAFKMKIKDTYKTAYVIEENQ